MEISTMFLCHVHFVVSKKTMADENYELENMWKRHIYTLYYNIYIYIYANYIYIYIDRFIDEISLTHQAYL